MCCNCKYLLFCIIVNKRLDEWVTIDRLDVSKIQLPKKDTKSNSRKSQNESHSRTASPEHEVILVSNKLLFGVKSQYRDMAYAYRCVHCYEEKCYEIKSGKCYFYFIFNCFLTSLSSIVF